MMILLISALFFNKEVSSQTRISSPYTMYGLGEIYFNNNFRTLGMGGLSIGVQSNTSVNFINPASYVAVDTNSFVFESILFSHFYGQKTADQSQMTNYSSLGSLSFAFPVYKWWASAFGLTPFSAVGYKVFDQQAYEEIGTINYTYEGLGGIHQVYWGNAFKLGKGFSFGVNSSYLFGNFKDVAVVSSDSTNFYLSTQDRSISARGLMFNAGVQYKKDFSADRELIVGATFGNATKLNAYENILQVLYLPGYTVPDTVQNYVDKEGDLVIPANWAVGFTYKANKKWMAGVDFYNQNWQDLQFANQSLNLNNSYQISLGTQYTPEIHTYSTFLSKLRYTAGVRYKQTHIIHNQHAVNEVGIGFGFNFRLRRSLSGMSFGFEWANRGDLTNNKLREDLFKFNIGINIHERWFIRSKFY
jgi:hypothetical protein